jgi:leucyl/phenylalanyl-tRNA--protein transferase
VLQTAHFRLHRSLKKTLRHFIASPGCVVTIDQAFERVLHQCAHTTRDGQAGTWIVPEMREAYSAWHAAGQVHSFETWINGELVGGLYGVGLGRMFYGESMFSRTTDASKIALAALVAFCRQHGVAWIDCQQQTGHLASLGAQPVSRAAFEAHLRRAVPAEPIANWSYDEAMWMQLALDGGSPPSRDPRDHSTPG